MKPTIGLLLLTGCWSAGALAGNAQLELACQTRLPPTQLRVTAQEAPIEILNDRPLAQLTQELDRESGHHMDNQRTLGITRSMLRMDVTYQLSLLTDPASGQSCARPVLNVSIVQPYHQVLIAREFPPGSCLYNEIRNHEYRHVRVNLDNLRWARTVIEREMQAYYQNRILYGSKAGITAQLRQTIHGYWIPRLAALQKASLAQQRAIDSAEEYERASKACNGEASRVLRAQALER